MTVASPLPSAASQAVIFSIASAGVRPSNWPELTMRPWSPISVKASSVGRLALGRLDHRADRQVERLGEVPVALVVGRDRHQGARAVVHEDVVGDEDRDLLAVHRVGDDAAGRDAGLGALLVAAVLGRGAGGLVDVVADGLLVLGARDERLDIGVLGRQDEERRAEERVGAGREDGEVEVELVAAEGDLGALGAADPVALHRDDVLGPGVEEVEVVEQALRVVGDLEEPLREAALDDEGAAALAAAVDDLLVGEDRLVLRAPLDGGLGAVGEALLEELEEDPLRPAVVGGLVGRDLAGPVERDAPLLELLAERGDRALGGVLGVLAGRDRVVLGGQAEGVVAHRVDHVEAARGGGSGRSRRRPSST